MNGNSDSFDNTNDERFDQLVAAYVKSIEEGRSPDREQILSANPDLAEDLREFFLHRDKMENLLDPLRSASTKVLTVRCPSCSDTVELHEETQLNELNCSACGTRFSLVSDDGQMDFPSGQRKIGQFELIELVGSGEFGKVWKARDTTLQRNVAIKIPRRGRLNSMETEMFLRDARLAAQLKHPNIVTVHEVGKEDSIIYIVSDFIEGSSLKEWIKQKRFAPREAAELAATIASGLAHAHESGVIHRDLKPGNVMLDLQGIPYIVDFGLAKHDNSEVTMTEDGQILGTPAYMSPEQARGDSRHVDPRSDIYSLGVVLFELLTGELPFRGQIKMLIYQILHDDPPSPRRLNNHVTRDLETICLKCLEKEPSRRYPNAQEVVDDLQRTLAGEPIRARPLTRPERLFRWCQRNQRVAFLAASLFLVLLSVTVISPAIAIYQARLRTDREQALAAQRVADANNRELTIDALLLSTSDELPEVLRNLSRFDPKIRPLLLARLESKSLSRQQILRVQLARLLYESESVEYVRGIVANEKVTPDELRAICQTIREFVVDEKTLAEFQQLWAVVEDNQVSTRQRMQATSVLANVDDLSNKWAEHSLDIANFLATRPPLELSDWIACLAPVGKTFEKALESVFRAAETESERTAAMTGLICLLGDELDSIVELIKVAEPAELASIIRHLESQPELAIDKLTRELDEGRPFQASALAGSWQIPSDTLETILSAEGYVSDHFIVCQALPVNQFDAICNSLRQGRYCPHQCRPYRSADDVLVAAIWLRESNNWTVAMDLTQGEVETMSDQLRSKGQHLADVAGYIQQGTVRFIGIWRDDPQLAKNQAVSFAIVRSKQQDDVDHMWQRGLRPFSVHSFCTKRG